MTRALPLDSVLKSAWLSEDGVYRYSLVRRWDDTGGRVGWIMLNPSTADASLDDPTIRRCVDFSKAWGFGALEVVNLFALRATDPRALAAHAAPIGPENDRAIARAAARADLLVAAWGVGTSPLRLSRAKAVAANVGALVCLGITAAGHPRHPLYVSGRTPYSTWDGLKGLHS